MNLVGKIFVVLICVMSIMFMAMATAVYTANTNWREEALAKKKALDEEKASNEATRNEMKALNDSIATLKAERRTAMSKLESELNDVKVERERLEKEHATLEKDKRDAVAAMKTVEETLAGMRKDQDGLRDQSDKSIKARDDSFQKIVKTTDELQQAVNELKRLKDRNRDLAEQVANMRRVAETLKIDLTRSDAPPVVDGIVMAVEGSDLIEISVGSDDGLAKGHLLEVYRLGGGSSQYLGRVQVVKTEPERAVCNVLPNFRRGMIQKGDRVATRLN